MAWCLIKWCLSQNPVQCRTVESFWRVQEPPDSRIWRFVCSARACQCKWQSRPAGAHQSGRRSKDVTTCRWIDSVKLVVSLLPSAFRLLFMGMRTKKQPMRHPALLPQKFRWHKYGKPEVRVDSCKAGPFIQAIVPLSRMCAVTQILRFSRRRCR